MFCFIKNYARRLAPRITQFNKIVWNKLFQHMNNFEAIILMQSTGMSFYNIENELDLMMLAYGSCFREEL